MPVRGAAAARGRLEPSRRSRYAPAQQGGSPAPWAPGAPNRRFLNALRDQQQRRPHRAAYEAILLALLAVLLVGVLTFDRSEWPALIGDEATYLMAAASLAWDLDLQYERQDYDRFLEHWQLQPEGLILQSGDAGGHITFGKPFFFPLWAAPFVRLSPTRGPFLANFVAVAFAALLASRTLRQTIGAVAPMWVACSLFASVAFAYTFWAHADLFLLALTASALSLAFWRQPEGKPRAVRTSRWILVRWMAVGAFLAIVVFSRPLYLPLFLPVVFALPRTARWRAGVGLVVGAVGLTASAAVVHRLNGDAWTSYGAQRRGFYESTGFPAVDFPAAAWQESLDDLGDAAWAEARTLTTIPRTSASLWWWNSIYFVTGRFVGVLPYFLPLVLGLVGWRRGVARWMLLAAVLISIAGFFLYRPFNFYGGGGAMANRYFMPLFPAFWFMASHRCRPRRIVLVVLVAAPFLWPLWSEARSFPKRANHTYRYVSSLATHLLPYETTQSHLKPAGRSDVVHHGLWVKFLSPTLRENRDGTALLLDRGSRGELLMGAYKPLKFVELQTLGDPAEGLVAVAGGQVLDDSPNDHGRQIRLELKGPRARHPMWWTWDTFFLYELTLESDSTAPGRLTFTLRQTPNAERGAS